LRMGLRQRAAEHGEILGEGKDGAAIDGAEAGDDAVAGNLALLHAEFVGAVLDEHVELLERGAVHQQFHALARGELAALVLRVDARLAAALPCASAPRFELVDNVFHQSLKLQQMIKILTVGALGKDIAPPAPPGIAAAAFSSAASGMSEHRMSSHECSSDPDIATSFCMIPTVCMSSKVPGA